MVGRKGVLFIRYPNELQPRSGSIQESCGITHLQITPWEEEPSKRLCTESVHIISTAYSIRLAAAFQRNIPQTDLPDDPPPHPPLRILAAIAPYLYRGLKKKKPCRQYDSLAPIPQETLLGGGGRRGEKREVLR